MKKRYLVAIEYAGVKNGIQYLRAMPMPFWTSLDGKVLGSTLWSKAQSRAKHFATADDAEKAAFKVCLRNPGKYLGKLFVVRTRANGRAPLKVRRRIHPKEERNYGRWPNSTRPK